MLCYNFTEKKRQKKSSNSFQNSTDTEADINIQARHTRYTEANTEDCAQHKV